MTNVSLASYNSNRYKSAGVWGNCPWSAIQNGSLEGYAFEDDFESIGVMADGVDGVVEGPYPYTTSSSAGVTFTKVADTDYGVARVAGTDADEDGFVLVHGNAAGWARFGPTDNVWFECRAAQGAVADSNAVNAFGFVEVNAPPTSVITQVDATGVLDASEDFVAWSSLQADGDALRAVYQLGGQTLGHVGVNSTNATGSGVSATLTAATFAKYGIRWTGERLLLEYFVNGERVAYYKVPASSTTFPFVNHLAMFWAFKTTAAAEVTADMDWWAGAYQSLA